ncbi:MAG: anti-sigma factor [Halioglobus sp.]
MNYRDPELVEQLAAEYVLGTMTGQARKRFHRLLLERNELRQAVWRWESRLGELCTAVTPLVPPTSTWQAIETRLWGEQQPGEPSPRQGWWNSLGLWRSWSVLASTLVVALALLLLSPVEPAGPDHVSVIGTGSEPLWVISANLESGRLTATAINATAVDVDKAFELWMLPASGNPVSMGLLPVSGGKTEQALPPGLLALLKQSQGLAVSIEPAGGSPTGLPTGPVVHTASMLAL